MNWGINPRGTRWRKALLGTCLSAACVAGSDAVTLNWTNTVGGSWETPGNWNPNQSPTNGDVIRIVFGQNFTVNVDDTTASNAANPWLTVNDIRVQGGSSGNHPTLLINFTNPAAALVTTGTGDPSLDLRESGAVVISNGTLIVNGLLRIGTLNTGTVRVAGGTLIRTNGTSATSIGAPSSLTVSAGRYLFRHTTVDGRYLITGGTNESMSTGNAITLDGTIAQPGLLSLNGGVLLFTNSGANMRIGNTDAGTLVMSNGTLRGYNVVFGESSGGRGEWTLAGGEATILNNLTVATPDSSTGILTIASAGLIELGSATTTVGGTGTGRGFITNRNGGTVRFTGANNPSLTVRAGGAFVVTNAAVEIKDASAVNLNGSITNLTVRSHSTLRLNHASNALVASSTFDALDTGNFTTLNLSNGAAFLATSTTVDSGGFITGDGTVSGFVAVKAGGALSPGNSFGVLTIGNGLTMESNSFLRLEIGPSQNDLIEVISAVSLSNSILQLTPTADVTTGTFLIVDNDGTGDAVSGMFQGLTNNAFLDASANGFDAFFTIQYDAGDGNDVVLFGTIPEPSALALAVAASLLIVLRRRA